MSGVITSLVKTSIGSIRPLILASCRSAPLPKPIPNIRKYAVAAPSDFTFRQLFDYRTWTYTYILGDNVSKEAVIIDPVLEMVDRDVKLATELGLVLIYALNTHMHADHITGSGEISKRTKKCKSVIAKYTSAKSNIYVDDGDLVKFGKFKLDCRSTPGHTDGCMTFVWHEKGMAFTGDAIFVRGCGRTDFQQGSPEKLYTACHQKILSLPDHFFLYPGHDYNGHTVTTVAEEKKFNPRLTKSLAEFKDIMDNLNLPPPKFLDTAIPANMVDGLLELLPKKSTVETEKKTG